MSTENGWILTIEGGTDTVQVHLDDAQFATLTLSATHALMAKAKKAFLPKIIKELSVEIK